MYYYDIDFLFGDGWDVEARPSLPQALPKEKEVIVSPPDLECAQAVVPVDQVGDKIFSRVELWVRDFY